MSSALPPSKKIIQNPFLRKIIWIVGFFFFAAGFIGIYLPGLPTVPFWILAVICFTHSSPKLRHYIVTFPKIGPTIEQFVEEGILSSNAKKAAFFGIFFSACLLLLLWFLSFIASWTLILALSGMCCGILYVASRPQNSPQQTPTAQDTPPDNL